MNSATANSSDTPSRTLMEVSPFSGECRVWGNCPQEWCKGTRARVWAGRKDGVKSGFMRALVLGWTLSGASPLPHLARVLLGQPVGGGLPPIAPAQPAPHLTGATPQNSKRQTIPHTTVAPLYDTVARHGMAAATP